MILHENGAARVKYSSSAALARGLLKGSGVPELPSLLFRERRGRASPRNSSSRFLRLIPFFSE